MGRPKSQRRPAKRAGPDTSPRKSTDLISSSGHPACGGPNGREGTFWTVVGRIRTPAESCYNEGIPTHPPRISGHACGLSSRRRGCFHDRGRDGENDHSVRMTILSDCEAVSASVGLEQPKRSHSRRTISASSRRTDTRTGVGGERREQNEPPRFCAEGAAHTTRTDACTAHGRQMGKMTLCGFPP